VEQNDMAEDRMDLAEQWRMCTRKRRFATEELANNYVIGLWLKTGEGGLKAYRCRVPEQEKHWHVGHLITWWRREVWKVEDSQP
jgi:hypothetical protein